MNITWKINMEKHRITIANYLLVKEFFVFPFLVSVSISGIVEARVVSALGSSALEGRALI